MRAVRNGCTSPLLSGVRIASLAWLVACSGPSDDTGATPEDTDSAEDTDSGVEDTDSGDDTDSAEDTDSGTADSGDTDSATDDADRDGWTVADGDCDDSSATVRPDAEEICNDGADNDCDGGPNDCVLTSGSLASGLLYEGGIANDLAYLVAGIGDLNADGYADIAIGTVFAGHAYVVLGAASMDGAPLTEAITYTGTTSENAGRAVAGAGDLDGDGFDDLIVGASGYDGVGGAYIIAGSPGPASMSLARADAVLRGDIANGGAGGAVSGAGDFNGDGWPDVLIGAPTGTSGAGRAYVVLGDGTVRSSNLGTAVSFTGVAADDYAGDHVDFVGDFDADGLDDVVVAATGADVVGANSGAVYLVLGDARPTGATLAGAVRWDGAAASDYAGNALSRAGDFNGDGYRDVAVGSPNNATGGAYAGAVYVVLGTARPDDAPLSDALTYVGDRSYSWLGQSLGAAGDLDGDGFDDLLIGTTMASSSAGRVYIAPGGASPSPSDVSDFTRFDGESAGDMAGYAVAGPGDVNGDGARDIAIGALNSGANMQAGAMYLLFGTSR